MFERYTERARRVIFFGRYEASRFGSPTIETEHLLLGLLREDKPLFERLRPNTREDLRQKIEEQLPSRPKISTSIDLPLSNECKRILGYANEESQKLNHAFLGTEHLLLGMLRESGCLAARVLGEAGLQLDPLRETIAKSEPDAGSGFDNPIAPVDRPSLHALVDKVSERHLGWLNMLMSKMMPPSQAAGGPQDGRLSSSFRSDDGALVVQTQQFLGSHKIFVEERFQLSEDGKRLLYSHEVTGPKPEQRHKHSVEFDVTG